VLQSVNPGIAHGRLVEDGQVPPVEVHRPQGQRDRRVHEHPQTIEEADAQRRGQDRGGQAEDEQQGPEVGDEQVLGHVGEQQLIRQMPQR